MAESARWNLKEIRAEKAELRKRMKALRSELSGKERLQLDQSITEQLLAMLDLPEYSKTASGVRLPVYCYVSHGTEADTHALLEIMWSRDIPVAVPRVEGSIMNFYQVHCWQDLSPGCMGILEPVDTCMAMRSPEAKQAVVITPGLAFTNDGRRIGYGGGFYDRFFEREPEHKKIAVAYPCQIVEQLPMEPCDIKIQTLITGRINTE